MFTLLDMFMPQMYIIRIEHLFIIVNDHTTFTDVCTPIMLQYPYQ